MKKYIISSIGLALALSITQVQAATSIEEIAYDAQASGYFNCAYKRKIASKKCLVTTSQVQSSIDPRTKAFYGTNQMVSLMTIKWPDGDTSRYINMDSFELINLADKKQYHYKSTEIEGWDFDLTRGLIIENADSKEHIRLW